MGLQNLYGKQLFSCGLLFLPAFVSLDVACLKKSIIVKKGGFFPGGE
jgi:hypothetical protein